MPEAEGNLQAPRHTRPDPRPDNTAGLSASQRLERSSPKSICRQTDWDWTLLLLELLPYMLDGLAHHAEKVGDTQQLFTAKSCFYIHIKYIYDLKTNFVDNIFKRVWALFCTQLNGFKYCYIAVKN